MPRTRPGEEDELRCRNQSPVFSLLEGLGFISFDAFLPGFSWKSGHGLIFPLVSRIELLFVTFRHTWFGSERVTEEV